MILRPVDRLGPVGALVVMAGRAALIVLRPLPAGVIGALLRILDHLQLFPDARLVGLELILDVAQLPFERACAETEPGAVILQALLARIAPLAQAVIAAAGIVRLGVETGFIIDVGKDAAGNRFVASQLSAQVCLDRELVALLRMRGERTERDDHAQRQDPADQSFLHALLLFRK